MKSITVKIAAGKSEEFALVGDYVRIKTASVPVRIETNSGGVDATIEQGDALNLSRFERLTLSHSDAGDQTFVLLIGNGTSSDSSKVGGNIAVSAMPSRAVPLSQTSVAVGVASVQVAAASAVRSLLLIQNTSTGGQDIFVNLGAAAAAVTDLKMAQGASLLLDVATPSGAVNAIASAAGGAVVVVTG